LKSSRIVVVAMFVLVLLGSVPGAALAVGSSASVSDASRQEGDNATRRFRFYIRLDAPATGGESVHVRTVSGSANHSDYKRLSRTVTWATGETTKSVEVRVYGDTDKERNEIFRVRLTDPNGIAVSDDTGVGTIRNDDTKNEPPFCSGVCGGGF
jgi:hypothetical protein